MLPRILCLAALALAACGDADEPAGARVRMLVAPDGSAPAYGEVPMPTDALRAPDGQLEPIAGLEAVMPGQTELFSRHLTTLDGFGVRPTVSIFIDGAIDPTSLPAETAALGDAIFVAEIADGSVAALPYAWRWDAARAVLSGAPLPGVVLREGALHAAVITSALSAASGAPLLEAEGLAQLSGHARWASTRSALDTLRALPELRAPIAGLAVFTPQHATRALVAARQVVDELPEPELTFDDPELVFDDQAKLDALLGVAERDARGVERWGWSNPTGIAHDHVAVIATGTMTLPRFRRSDSGDDEPTDETFEIDESGTPIVAELAAEVPVTFVLPSGAPPPSGFPVLVFGHGLGASRHAVLTFAEPLAAAGFAIACIDMAGHGSRLSPADEGNNLAAVIAEFNGDAGLRDGFGDDTGLGTTLDLVEGFVNLSAFRDSLRQSVLDLGGLVRLLKRSDLDLSALAAPYGGEAPQLDATRVAYLGESYGSVVGSVLAAVEPDIDLFVLDVGGGGILDLALCEGPGLRELVLPFVRSVYGVEGTLDRFHPAVALAQALLDGADPLAFAPHVLGDRLGEAGPRHVVVLEVIGDELIPNLSTGALARAMGLELLAPWLHPIAGVEETASPASANLDGQTAVVVQYAPAAHGSNWTTEIGTLNFYPVPEGVGDERFQRLPEPIDIQNPLYATLEQVVEILQTHRATGIPSVRSTAAPIADFDDDGVLDDDELAAGTDPYDPGS